MLDPKAFDQAMNRLAILPVQGEDPADLLVRKEIYFEALSDLDTDCFVAGAQMALRECRWFPTPAELRDYAEASRPRHQALPPPSRTEAEIEAGREAARKGLDLIRAAVANASAKVLRVSVPDPPARVVHATPERLAYLREQAREIVVEK